MVRIYFEGDPRLREGLREFLKPEVEIATTHLVKLELVGAGTKEVDQVCVVGRRNYPKARHLILKDAEGALPRKRLKDTYYWVQVMESWFLADPAAIESALGPCVKVKMVPNWPNVEVRPKADILKLMSRLTKPCGSNKHYDEKDHPPSLAGRILARLKRDLVVRKSPECAKFLAALKTTIHELSAETS